MAFNLPFATLIGYSSRGDFFGDDIARWRTVQTVTIEGIMNPNQIDNMSNDGSDSPASTNTYLGHNVTINGEAVGGGNTKLISLDFPASEHHTEAHDGKAKYIATYEVYIVPTSNSFFGVSFNDLKDLEEYSEDISYETSEDGTTSATMDMSVKYAGSNGIAAAKALRNAVWGVTPIGVPGSVVGDGVLIWNRAGHWYQTEVYDIESNSCNFSSTRRLLANIETNYTSKIDTSLTIGEDGIINITESGEIHGQRHANAYSSVSPEMDSARDGASAELSNSYNRCLAIYNIYKNAANTNAYETAALSTQYSERNVNYDEQAGKVTYSTTYTNNPSFETSGYVFESKISKAFEKGQGGSFETYTEEAEIKQYAKAQDPNYNRVLYTAIYDKTASAYTRLTIAFPEVLSNLTIHGIPTTTVSKKTSFKPSGKTASLSIKYSRDASLFPFGWGHGGPDYWSLGGTKIHKLEKEFSTSGGVTKKEWYNPPNNPIAGPGRIGGEFLHVGNDMVEPTTRKVTYTGQMRRNRSGNADTYGDVVNNLMRDLAPYLKLDALNVYTEYWVGMDPVFWNKYYYSSFSWTFKSSYEFTATIELKLIVPNGSITGGYFWQHSDNTQIIA